MKNITFVILGIALLASMDAEAKRKRRQPKEQEPEKKYECASTSLFYKPTLDLTKPCDPEEKTETFQVRIKEEFQEQSTCEKTLAILAMEGAAWITDPATNTRSVYNIINNEKPYKFHQMSAREIARCPYAYGAVDSERHPICLDPFFSVAGDSSCHKVGDVFFFPDLVGMRIPKEFQSPGRKVHDGYVIFRDVGTLIKGCNRFDFYTGPMYWANRKNPLFRKGMYDKLTCQRYEKVEGPKADEVRARHNFPNIPTSVLPPPKPPEPNASLGG